MLPTKERVATQEHVSIIQAARLMGVSRRTVYNWIKGRRVKWIRTPGRRIRILVDSLGVFINEDEIFYN